MVTEGDNMDKIIQLGIEARRHDSKIAQIESQRYAFNITDEEAFELIEVELVRYNLAWRKVMKEEQFMKDQALNALNIN